MPNDERRAKAMAAREKLKIENARDQENDQELGKDRDIERGATHGM